MVSLTRNDSEKRKAAQGFPTQPFLQYLNFFYMRFPGKFFLQIRSF